MSLTNLLDKLGRAKNTHIKRRFRSGPRADAESRREQAVEQFAHHVGPVHDLISCLGTDREPACGINEGAMTIEMICAIPLYASAVYVPLSSWRMGWNAITTLIASAANVDERLLLWTIARKYVVLVA